MKKRFRFLFNMGLAILVGVPSSFASFPSGKEVEKAFVLAPLNANPFQSIFRVSGLTDRDFFLVDSVMGNLKTGDKLWGGQLIETIEAGKNPLSGKYTLRGTGAVLEIVSEPDVGESKVFIKATSLVEKENLEKAAIQILGVISDDNPHKTMLEKIKSYLVEQKGNDQYFPVDVEETYDGMVANAVIVSANGRDDRMKHWAEIWATDSFLGFPLPKGDNILLVGLKAFIEKMIGAFRPNVIKNHIIEVLSQAGISSAGVAEAQKAAHVTSFFNGGSKEPLPGDTWRIVNSPKPPKGETIAAYPEMSAKHVTEVLLQLMAGKDASVPEDRQFLMKDGAPLDKPSTEYSGDGVAFIRGNYANLDQVGHEGKFKPVVQAVAAVDKEQGRLMKKAREEGWIILSTADHGNGEEMLTERGKPSTKHSLQNPVNFTIYDPLLSEEERQQIQFKTQDELGTEPSLAHVAPTILKLMGLDVPSEMGSGLLAEDEQGKILYPHLRDANGKKRKVLLLVKDGWGETDKVEGNAVKEASRLGLSPNNDYLVRNYPTTRIYTHGKHVGNQDGKMGNSDAGHTILSAGRPIPNIYTIVDDEIQSGKFKTNETLLETFEEALNRNTPLHLMGLLSDEGVHADHYHLFAMLELALEKGVRDIRLHPRLDGRDSDPGTGLYYMLQLETRIQELERRFPDAKIRLGTVSGRDDGMARGADYDQTERVYRPMRYGRSA